MHQLRAPGGCPWDREQTHDSLIPYLVEESYEVIEAIEQKKPDHLCEELGDLLLQVVFHTELAAEKKEFTIEDVSRGICEKLVRRHPHVFAETIADNADQVLKNWEEIKATEKKPSENLLDAVPRAFPALLQAHKLSKKAAKVGFDWPDVAGVLDKINEEVLELKEAMESKSQEAIVHEAGDLLFSVVNFLRHLKIDSEEALRLCNERFRTRFANMESQMKSKQAEPKSLSLADWETLWAQAKKDE